jgi:hypothetical protein
MMCRRISRHQSRARAISTALGYNQLLTTNSVELLAEKGDQFVAEIPQSWAA